MDNPPRAVGAGRGFQQQGFQGCVGVRPPGAAGNEETNHPVMLLTIRPAPDPLRARETVTPEPHPVSGSVGVAVAP